jgi:hypothetical protein
VARCHTAEGGHVLSLSLPLPIPWPPLLMLPHRASPGKSLVAWRHQRLPRLRLGTGGAISCWRQRQHLASVGGGVVASGIRRTLAIDGVQQRAAAVVQAPICAHRVLDGPSQCCLLLRVALDDGSYRISWAMLATRGRQGQLSSTWWW